MDKEPKEYIKNITKASTYFMFRNGPVSKMHKENKLSDDDIKEIQIYMQNHLAYIYNILLEENNLKKFELIVNTMNKFYVQGEEEIQFNDDGFDELYKSLFPGIDLKL
ncbi:MAG: hypothetical protein ACRC7N_10810 [Clostridium sp.]